jgi:hypothetical protein
MTVLIKSAAKLALDVLVLVGLGAILGRKRQPRYFKLLFGSLAVAVAYLAYDLLPRWMLGYLFIVPLFVAAGLVLAIFGRVSWKWAAAGSAIFVVTHTVVRFFA